LCTSVFQIGQQDGAHVLARTMDWPRLGAKPVAVPRSFHWQSVFDNHEFISQYAVLGSGSQHDHEIDISDGVNEYGLAVQKLTFTNGSNLTVEPTSDKVHLAPFELSYYLLSTFKSVEEIISHIDQIELMADNYSLTKYGHSELHFAASDSTGRIVVIEPVTQPIEVIDNPLGIVTNSNHFQRQIDRLGDYVDFTSDFKNQTVPLNAPRVTTGKVSGKMTPPGSYTPGSRFIRAAYLKERIDLPDNEADAVDNSWHILDSVNVPKSSEHQLTYSVYRAAVCSESRTLYYQSYSEKQIIKIKLTSEMITAETPRFFEINDKINFVEMN